MHRFNSGSMISQFLQWIARFFQSADFMPHGHCYYWRPSMVWSHALADGVIAMAYFAIPIVLLYVFRKRSTTQYGWIIALFALFIMGCGLTHVMDVVTIWNPLYRIDAILRIITALASVGTAFALVKITPRLLHLPTEEEWRQIHEELRLANEVLQDTNLVLASQTQFIEKVAGMTPDTIVVMNLDDATFSYSNRDIAETFGYSKEAFSQMSIQERQTIIHPDDRSQREQFFQRFKKLPDHEIQEVEYRVRFADETYHYLLLRGSVFSRTAEGEPQQIVGIALDITALKQTQEKLKENVALLENNQKELQAANDALVVSNEKMVEIHSELIERKHFIERITNTVPHIIYIFDLALFRPIYVNRDIMQTLGYSYEAIYSRSKEELQALFHPEDFEKRNQYYQDFVNASDQEIREVEFRIMHADGQYRHFLISGTVFHRNEEGAPTQIISVSQDITTLKETEQNLREALMDVQATNEELNSANEEISAANEELGALNETLIERNHFIELITDTTPNTIYIFDLTLLQTVYANKDAFRSLGYNREEAYARGTAALKELVHPDDLERRMAFYREFATALDGEIRQMEFRFKHADGSYNWLLIRSTVFKRNAEGIPTQTINIAQDITYLKKTEAELREVVDQLNEHQQTLQQVNEELLASNDAVAKVNEELAERNHFIEKVADTTPNPIYIFDLTTFQPVYVNKDVYQALGYSQQDIFAMGSDGLRNLFHPDDFEKRNQFYREFAQASDQEIRELEVRTRHIDGQYRHFLIRGAVFQRDAFGVATHQIGIMQDITQLKQTEIDLRNALADLTQLNEELLKTEKMLLDTNEKLKRSEERARLLTEGVKDYAILMLTPEGNIASWNAGAQRIKGYQANEIIGVHFSAFYLPEAVANQYPAYELKKAQEEGRFEDEGWRVRKDGSLFWANVVITPLYDGQHTLIGYSKITRDMTEKVKNEELTRKNQELVQINADLDNFVYTASHDLKHPITNLEGLLAVFHNQLNSQLSEENKQWLDMMSLSVLRLKSTIHYLTEISKVQKGIEEAAEELDFAQMTEEIKQDLTHLIEQNQADVRTDFRMPTIRYAAKNLRSILINLVSNAIKYCHPNRRAEVEVSTYAEGTWTVLAVKDNGLGLSEKDQKKLFQMFKRLHDHVEGTGIGLYMLKRIVDNHGGRLAVDSQLGIGSTFFVYFKSLPA